MIPDDFDPDDFNDDGPDAAERKRMTEQWAVLRERLAAAEPELVKIGLYSEDIHPQPIRVAGQYEPGGVAIFQLGDVAFTKRVQDPDAHQVDTQLDGMESAETTNEFLDERERIRKARARGIDPFSDEAYD